ncbi:MAG TPA: virulence factor [Paucimonas sp.]|nr:virulence factor [Paucimonas sp.]
MSTMKNSLSAIIGWIAGAALLAGAPAAFAHDRANVSWSITVGTPQPAPVYIPPPEVVYSPPPRVYVYPQPVYVRPAPIVEYRTYYPQPRYVEEVRHKRWHHHKRHHYHHHHHRHHHWNN